MEIIILACLSYSYVKVNDGVLISYKSAPLNTSNTDDVDRTKIQIRCENGHSTQYLDFVSIERI